MAAAKFCGFYCQAMLFSSAAIFDETCLVSAKAMTEVMVSGFVRSAIRERCADVAVRSEMANCWVSESRDMVELATVIGQCSAEARIAHLLLHLTSRIAARSVIREHSYSIPIRQQHIADAVGLTSVHVSRIFGLFRNRGILTMSDGILKVMDMPELERLSSLK
jgi:CRP-like cAMP-binding protein